jgi:hypothetical protein
MIYKSKRTLVNIAAGIAILIIYILYVTGGNAPGTDDVKEWAILMLKFIGLGVVVIIPAQIIFHIGFSISLTVKDKKEDGEIKRVIKSESVEDERDSMISLWSMRVGYALVGIGCVAMLFLLALEYPVIFALNIMFLSALFAMIAEGTVSVFLYETGARMTRFDKLSTKMRWM